MIDWTKPVYDRGGDAWFALFTPDGSPFVPKTGERLLYRINHPDTRMYVRADGTCDAGWVMTNTPSIRDWESTASIIDGNYPRNYVRVRGGYRNGKPFVELIS